MPEHTVRQGECIASIAKQYGLLPDTIWNHSENAELRERRQDSKVLLEGDVVFIPEPRHRTEPCATDQRHQFRRKGVPAKLRVRIARRRGAARGQSSAQATADSGSSDTQASGSVEHEPRANVPYVLDIDGRLIDGETDADGRIEASIPPDARRGRLILEPGTLDETIIPLELGHLNPLDTLSGVRHRLTNLGYDCGDAEDAEDPDFQAALRAFQEDHGLTVTGEIDQQTRARLRELHGS
jgi:N-acetylmuramoyl-L-alanine amidase